MIICIYDATEYGSCMIDDVLFDMLDDYNFDMFYDYNDNRMSRNQLNFSTKPMKIGFMLQNTY